MPDVHAKLSASASHRWLNCTPSIRLEQESGIPDNNSKFAAEGTLAHAVAETMLLSILKRIDEEDFHEKMKSFTKEEDYGKDMEEAVSEYLKIVTSAIDEARERDMMAFIGVEERLNYSRWAKEGFGTGDVVIISDGQIEIIDLKYGKGVPVDAEDNPQMKLYALGAYDEYSDIYDDITRIKVTIVQPRINHTNSWETDVETLLKWGDEYVKPRADLAFNGEGEVLPGEWCRFCRAKPICRAYNERQLELAKMEFKDPDLLSDDEVADVLKQVDDLTKWATSVKEYAQSKAISQGAKFKGFKLVEGRSNRKITDEKKLEKILKKNGFFEEDLYEDPKMIGITKLEKLVGKSRLVELAGDCIVKPKGAPTLVEETDKRDEWEPDNPVDEFSKID